MNQPCGYAFDSPDESHMHRLYGPPVVRHVAGRGPVRVIDIGCGNGALCRRLRDAGCDVVGVDLSPSGIAIARTAHPDIRFDVLGIYDEPPAEFVEAFDVAVATEVVEHLYAPRALPRLMRRVLKPGGQAILTTPYHGYLKNLAIALTGRWDRHHDALWDDGHIKFWSRQTLTTLFADEGFVVGAFEGLGRFPGLWMTMLMTFVAPR